MSMRPQLYSVIVAAVIILAACAAPPTDVPLPTMTVQSTLQFEQSGEEIRVGVLAIRSAAAANAQYGPIVSYLGDALGRPFVLVPVEQESQFTLTEQGNLEFVFTNPLAAVQLRRLYNTEFLATLSRIETGTDFGGLIVARSDSEITTLQDLRGKSASCVAFETAAAGCVFQIYHLLQDGIDPFTDFDSFTENPSQDNIVLGVLNGTIDAGFVRTGQLEKMVTDEILLDLSEIRILDQADDEFPYPHTTRLYPEWPFAALEDTDSELVEAVRTALLELPPDHPALSNAAATGFVPAVDYGPIEDLIDTLQLRGWEEERRD